ncbi:hypothetical protein [Luedemannella helvata]|uniref:Lipoprotein n=1 Tax=Luedemannella helvata TaxID=349315 RepID=A0ABP4WP78_9ACTN
MPSPEIPPAPGSPPRPTRRGLLRGAGALALGAVVAPAVVVPTLAGCSTGGDEIEIPGAAALADLVAGTADLVGRYDAVIAAYPALAARLTPLRDNHRAHLEALASTLALEQPAPSAQQAPPGGQSAALSNLAAAEKSGRADAVGACLAAPARLAPLLGSIAAARASHQEVLK